MPSDANSDKHISELKPDESHKKGCVTKHNTKYSPGNRCSYRGNGYAEMKGSRTALYHIDFTKKKNYCRLPYLHEEYMIGRSDKSDPANWRFADDPTSIADAWWFTRASNYTTAFLPYNHNYHHILPFDSIKTLEWEELRVLQESGYNLNGKENMIILPCLDAYGIAMMLPAHPYGHKVYNANVKSIVGEIKQDVEMNSQGHEIDPSNVSSFKAKLESWEKRQFNTLVDYGKSLAASITPEDIPEPNQVNNSPMATSVV